MSSEPQTRDTTTSGVERAAHAYCPVCNPDPQPGDLVTALCGATHPFWGRRERPVNTCAVCKTLAAATIFECGHLGQRR